MSAVPEPPSRRRRPGSTLLDEAFASLAAGRWVLVLDDAHELRSADALATLRHVLDHSPASLPVVLCARADPPVALGRLRLDGRLGEIRNADLEFTVDETSELFDAYGIELRHDDVRAIRQRTQGWVAGLRLAAGALDGADDRHELVRSATATEAAVAEYLLEEVLDRQEEPTQEFLLRTSVVERLTPGLAALLADDDDAQARLDDLVRSGVFLTDVSDGGWYRYHALFADLLRAGLRHRSPELVPELHHRAALWLLAQGATTEAENHARLAGDWPLVGRLVCDRWLGALLDDADLASDPWPGRRPRRCPRWPTCRWWPRRVPAAAASATRPTRTVPGWTSCSARSAGPRGPAPHDAPPPPRPGLRLGVRRRCARPRRGPGPGLGGRALARGERARPASAGWPGCAAPSCTSTTATSTPRWPPWRCSPTSATTSG